jgi:hypothetical protein
MISMATSQCGLPSMEENGNTKISSLRSSLACSVQSRQRLHGTGGVLVRLGQISDGGAALVDAYALGIGVVEIDSGHVRLPRLRFTLKNSRRETDLIFGEIADGILRGLRPQVEPARQFIEKFICAGARNEAFGSAVSRASRNVKYCGVEWWNLGRAT